MRMREIDRTGKRLMKGLIIGLLLILVSLASMAAPSPALAESEGSQGAGTSGDTDTLKFLSANLPPFGSLKDGKPVGFAVEIIHEIMQRLGRADTIEFDDWKVVYERVLTESGTVLMPPSRTPERENLFKWVGPLVPEKIVLFARRDSGLVINSLEDAKKVSGIATVTGYASEKLLKQKGFTNLVSQRSPTQGPDALKFGRADLWLNSNITMKQTALAANVDPDLLEPVFVVKEIPSYLAFSKSVPNELVNRWQAALDDMKRDGSWERTVSNWVPRELLRIGGGTLNLNEKERLWIEANPTVKVIHYFHEPPFTVDSDHAHAGYLYELLFEVLRLSGLKLEFVGDFSSYDSMVIALQDGAVDILTTMENTRRLSDDIVRTIPVVKTPYALVAKNSAPEVTRTSELFGQKVAVVKGYAQDQHLDRFPQIEKVHVRNNEEGFEAVRMGRAEYFLNNRANAAYVLKKTFATDLRIAGTLPYADFPPLTLSFGIYGKDSELPGIINKALTAVPMKALTRLRDKWLAEEFTVMDPDRISLTTEEDDYLRENPVLQVAFDVDWPPVEFTDKGAGMNGIAADYLSRMSELLGVELKPSRPRSWKEMMKAVKNGELDLFSAISPTPQRREWIDFTDSYLSFPIVIITGKEVPYIGSMSDLGENPVAVVDSYASHDLLLKNHPYLNLLPVQDVKEGLMSVSTGKALAFIGNLATVSYIVSREGLTDLKVSGETPYSFDISMGVRKDNTVLLKILGKALARISPEERSAINSRWTSVTFEYATDYSLIWRILGVALVIVVIVLYWNNRLKIEVAERKRAEETAEAANRAKSEFLANMSHELRTPLNAILGFAQIMERNPAISSEKESLKIIQRSGNHLLTLINQVLDLSKIEAGHITLEEHGFDLLHLLDELENMLSLRAGKKLLTLDFDCAQEVPRYIRTDEVKLRQVLINLLSNAIKFTDEGSVKLRVSLQKYNDLEISEKAKASLHDGKYVILFEIEDTGPGIAPEEMDGLFEAFGQTASGREAREGTGLGLLISYKFVQLMGGHLNVASEVGKGTTFGFDIRAQAAGAVEIPQESPGRRVVALEPGQPSYRILIVDDNSDNRQLLIRLLSPLDLDLREAGNGQEAIKIWNNWKPHLIWMDMRMPIMDGYEATRMIRAQAPSIPAPAIIAVTASVFEENRAAVMSIGCDDIVIKPFKESEIMEKLQKHLGVRFQYADNELFAQPADHKIDSSRLTTLNLSALPQKTVDKLKGSVAALEMDTTLTVIEEIRELDELLADALKKLVERYRFDTLQKLLDQDNQ